MERDRGLLRVLGADAAKIAPEQRILAKLALAAASVGVTAPIEGAAHGGQVFTETREEIEKLLREGASLFERGGTAGATQTGEEHRQTLRKALHAPGPATQSLTDDSSSWSKNTPHIDGIKS